MGLPQDPPSPTGSSQDCKAPCRWPSHNREGAWAPNDCEAQSGPTTSPPGPGSLLTERKPLCVRLLRFGGCWNQQSACYNKYALLRDTAPTSTRIVACSLLERAPGGPGLRPAFPSSSLGQGDGGQGARMPGPHTTTWAAPIPKKLYCFKWQNVIGLCGAPGRVEGDLRWGRAPPITKIKGFYKNCYKLVSKENPREAGGGSRGGGKRAQGGRDQNL